MQNFPQFDYEVATDVAIEKARSLIYEFDLHRNPGGPVEIGVLLDKFDVRFMEDLPSSSWGFTLDVKSRIIVAINNSLQADLMRFVAMHEIGHVALWHPNQFNACAVEGQASYDRLETEATTLAAYLLIPRLTLLTELVFGMATVGQLAERLIVPAELITIRRNLYQRTRL